MDTCSGKKMKPSYDGTVGRDRLSEMPNDVLLRILSFLPTIDAIRSVLLRTFGELWTLLPSIELTVFPNCVDYESYVLNVVTLHSPPIIEKFQIEAAAHENIEGDTLFLCLRHLFRKTIKILILNLTSYPDYFTLPVLKCPSLVSLALRSCILPEQFLLHMGSLREIYLEDVQFEDGAFDKLIAGCPRLRHLSICPLTELTDLCFTAPNIGTLSLEIQSCLGKLCCPNIKSLNLRIYDCATAEHLPVVDVSSLYEIDFQFFNYDEDPREFDNHEVHCWVNFFSFFRHVESVRISGQVFKVVRSLLKFIVLPSNRWKRLYLELKDINPKNLCGLLRMLESCDKLEELTISNRYQSLDVSAESNEGCGVDFSQIEIPSEFSFPCRIELKTVTIHGHTTYLGCLFQLVEFLLKNAVNLEKLIITPKKQGYILSMAEHLCLLQRVTKFCRESRNASVEIE